MTLGALIKHIVGPLRELTLAAQQVSTGDEFSPVSIKSRDEVGQLASSFNVMVENLKQIQTAFEEKELRLKEAQRISSIGSWEWDIIVDPVFQTRQ